MKTKERCFLSVATEFTFYVTFPTRWVMPCTGDTSCSKKKYFTSLEEKTNLDRKNRTNRKLTCESGSSCQLPPVCILILLCPFRGQKYLRKRNFTLAKVMAAVRRTRDNSQTTRILYWEG
jgi:hypothetical protein